MLRAVASFALALAFCSQANAQTNAPHTHASISYSKDSEIESLATNLDNVVKVCSAMSVRGLSDDKSIRRPEKFATDKGILRFLDPVPTELMAIAEPKFGTARFAQWFDPHATIYIIAYDNKPLCRALVSRSEWAGEVRPSLFKLIQIDNFWKSSEIDTKVDAPNGQLLRSVFLSTPGQTVQPMVAVTANEAVTDDGEIQLTITVAMASKGEK
ncbi:MAG: hypothetical protein ACK519_11775 [Sphingomonadaceae bacterium]|jgi:hypothetical protein